MPDENKIEELKKEISALKAFLTSMKLFHQQLVCVKTDIETFRKNTVCLNNSLETTVHLYQEQNK